MTCRDTSSRIAGNLARRGSWRILSFICGSFVMGSASAQTADLMSALHAAQVADPTIRAARATLDMALLKWPEARATLMPTIGLTANSNSTQANTEFSGIPAVTRSGDSRALTLQLVQPVFRADNFIANRQAPLLIDNAQAQFDQAQQDLLLRVATAYFALIVSKEAAAAADAQVSAMERQLLEISKGFNAGTRAVTDVDDTKARLGAAKAQQLAARGDIENAHADLRRLTGSRYSAPAALPEDMTLPSPTPLSVDEWISQAMENNPQVRALRAAVDVAELGVDRARAGHLPTVDLIVSLGHTYSNHSLTTPDDYSTKAAQKEIGFQINVPLFAGGAILTKVNQAQSALEKARADLDAARSDAANQAQHAFSSVLSDVAQIDALTLSVAASESALKGNQAGFRIGYRTNVDVLNAQQQLYSARVNVSKARYEALLQGFKLKAAAGILTEQDLLVVAALMH